MAITTLPGVPLTWPICSNAGLDGTTLLIDATGEKIAFVGQVRFDGPGTKNLTRVQFLFGGVTKAGGSGLSVSIQDVTANGAYLTPVGTPDQVVAIANGDAAFASNTWCRTGALNATRSVANGTVIAVVIEFDGSGRLGADSVAIQARVGGAQGTGVATLNTGSWAIKTVGASVLLEFDDGTFGTIGEPAVVSGAIGFAIVENDAGDLGVSAKEAGARIRLPVPVRVAGIWWNAYPAGNVAAFDFTLLIYDATDAVVGSIAMKAGQCSSTSTIGYAFFATPVELAADTDYWVAFRADGAGANRFYYEVMADAAHKAVRCGGGTSVFAQRLTQGEEGWDETLTTRLPSIGILISGMDNGAQGSAAVDLPEPLIIGA